MIRGEIMNEAIVADRSDSIATIMFNRPEQRNAISYEMWQSLGRILGELEDDSKVRCVVFRGAGGEAFSAGGGYQGF